MLSSSRPACRARSSQARRSARSGSCAVTVSSVRVRSTNVPAPGRGCTRPSCSSSRYALSTVFGLIASCGHDRLDGGQPIAFAQQAQPQRLAYLLDDLQVRRDAGAGIEQNSITDYPIILTC